MAARGKRALSHKSIIHYRGEWRSRKGNKQRQRVLQKANRRLLKRQARVPVDRPRPRRLRGKR